MSLFGMIALRIYDPVECDSDGVPLDWKQCRRCNGGGTNWMGDQPDSPCPGSCNGFGSLKAAALDYFAKVCPHGRPLIGRLRDHHAKYDPCDRVSEAVHRCEDCGHPMSDGTWEWRDSEVAKSHGLVMSNDAKNLLLAVEWLKSDREPQQLRTYYSPCDEGCRHDGEKVRWNRDWDGPGIRQGWVTGDITVPIGWHLANRAGLDGTYKVEASWRQVDVRTLGWPMDLRPEKLAVLCLRCYAAR